MHASTLLSRTIWSLTQHSLQWGCKRRTSCLANKEYTKNHCTYTTGCPFYQVLEHCSLENLHPPEHPVTTVMLRDTIKETPCIFNNSKFSKWQRRDRICTDGVKMNHSSILHFPTEELNNLRHSTWILGEDVPVLHKEEGLYPAHLHSFSHSPPPCLSPEVTCLSVVL